MKRFFSSILISTMAIGLISCAQPGMNNQSTGITKQQVGVISGGVVGGILGSQVFHGSSQVYGAVGGAILGSLLGSAIGQAMDRQDELNARLAMMQTPVGKEATWVNQNTHTSYVVRPVREYRSAGRYCRVNRVTTYTQSGRKQTANAVICRDSNGHWQLQG